MGTRLKATLGKLLYPLFSGCIQNNSSRFEEVQEEESSKAQKRARESDVADTSTKSDKKSKKLKAADGKPVVVETDAIKEGEKKVEAEKEKDGQKDKKKNKKEKNKVDTLGEKSTPAKKTIAGGIVIEDAVVGTGPMAKKGNTVRVRYVGKLTNGKEFDKNTSGKPVCGCVHVSVITSDPFPVRFPSRKGRSHQRYSQVTTISYSY